MSACADLETTDVAFAFKDITVSSLIPPQPFVSNVSGFIQAGCVTAGKIRMQ